MDPVGVSAGCFLLEEVLTLPDWAWKNQAIFYGYFLKLNPISMNGVQFYRLKYCRRNNHETECFSLNSAWVNVLEL